MLFLQKGIFFGHYLSIRTEYFIQKVNLRETKDFLYKLYKNSVRSIFLGNNGFCMAISKEGGYKRTKSYLSLFLPKISDKWDSNRVVNLLIYIFKIVICN